MFSNANRWIGWVTASKRSFEWLQTRLPNADFYRLTWQLWQNNKAQFEAVGLFGELDSEGNEVLRAPHVICGMDPFIRQET